MHCTSWELTASPLIAREIKRKLSSQLPMGPAMDHFPGQQEITFLGDINCCKGMQSCDSDCQVSSNMYFFLHGRFKTIYTNIKDPRTASGGE